jgi:hypothetical protein
MFVFYHKIKNCKTRSTGTVQKCSDARRAKSEPRGVYRHTSSGAVCSATQQVSFFQQFHLFRRRSFKVTQADNNQY